MKVAMSCLLLLAVAGGALAAPPPDTINYQGVLRDNTDRPLTGSFGMVFRLFDAMTAGNELIVDRHQSGGGGLISVTNGLFSTEIGSGVVSDGSGPGDYRNLTKVFGDYSAVWLEIQVGAETLAPRVRLVSSGYALNAGSLSGMKASSFVDTTSTAQSKLGEFSVNTEALGLSTPALSTRATTLGLQSDATGTAGRFFNRATNSEALLGTAGVGLQSTADVPGRFVNRTQPAATVSLADATYGISAVGVSDGGKFDSIARNAQAFLGRSTGVAVQGTGTALGAKFNSSLGGPVVSLGSSTYGANFSSLLSGSDVTIGGSSAPITVAANGSMARFQRFAGSDVVEIHSGGITVDDRSSVEMGGVTGISVTSQATGVYAEGPTAGGHFVDSTSGTYAKVAYDDKKITGTGGVSFVQNHPEDDSMVVVYTAPEGDEVAVYTRGTARLTDGVATVKLGETFPLVSNPDLGLTVHLTPIGEAIPLAVTEKRSDRIVVQGPSDSNAEFDYIVWGLRIGFERSSVLQPKEIDAPIPSMARHDAMQAQDPVIRAATAAERFRRMQPDERVEQPSYPSRASNLIEKIGVFEPSQFDTIASALGRAPIERPNRSAAIARTIEFSEAATSARLQTPQCEAATSPERESLLGATLVEVIEPVEAGELLVAHPEVAGRFARGRIAADPQVLGIALAAHEESGQVAVALSGIVNCNVDANFAPIRIGDLLTTSPTPGYAMRAGEPTPGTIIAKALEPLEVGSGKIRVLVMPR